MFLNFFSFYQVVLPLGRKSVNKYLYLYLYSGMTQINEGWHSSTCHTHVYPQVELKLNYSYNYPASQIIPHSQNGTAH